MAAAACSLGNVCTWFAVCLSLCQVSLVGLLPFELCWFFPVFKGLHVRLWGCCMSRCLVTVRTTCGDRLITLSVR